MLPFSRNARPQCAHLYGLDGDDEAVRGGEDDDAGRDEGGPDPDGLSRKSISVLCIVYFFILNRGIERNRSKLGSRVREWRSHSLSLNILHAEVGRVCKYILLYMPPGSRGAGYAERRFSRSLREVCKQLVQYATAMTYVFEFRPMRARLITLGIAGA